MPSQGKTGTYESGRCVPDRPASLLPALRFGSQPLGCCGRDKAQPEPEGVGSGRCRAVRLQSQLNSRDEPRMIDSRVRRTHRPSQPPTRVRSSCTLCRVLSERSTRPLARPRGGERTRGSKDRLSSAAAERCRAGSRAAWSSAALLPADGNAGAVAIKFRALDG